MDAGIRNALNDYAQANGRPAHAFGMLTEQACKYENSYRVL